MLSTVLSTILQALVTVAGIGLLMIVHESGHFFAARATGMRVLKFSIGAGPVLFRRQAMGSSTVFQVALVPFLAYVQIAGMNPFEENDPNDEGLFDKKSAFARAFVIAAGPMANYFFASLVVFALALSGHVFRERVPGRVTVTNVMPDGAALAAGLQANDVVLAIDGRATPDVDAVIAATTSRPGRPTVYHLERAGVERDLTITPRRVGSAGRIGAELRDSVRVVPSSSVVDAGRLAVVLPAELTVQQLKAIGRAFREKTTREFGGIVAMGRASMDAVEAGPSTFILFLVLISVALGFFNLLPFPALDGGRLVFPLIEVVFRRRINQQIEYSVNAIGMATLLTLMVLITYQDIARLP